MDRILYEKIPISAIQGYSRYRMENKLGVITITTENLESIINDPNRPKTIPGKLNSLLLSLQTKTKFGGHEVEIHIENDYPLAYAENTSEFIWTINQLISMRLLQGDKQGGAKRRLVISPNGWDKVAELLERRTDFRQCFVAMSFDKKFDKIYDNAISKAIIDCGFKPYRIDREEHTELIPFKMIADIRRSGFVVADFTKHVGGVYFEAGYAMGLNIPVIWICHKDDFAKAHFDIKQFNHIVYDNEDDLYKKLKARIEALIV